jgi:hypothetical protein
MKKVSSWLDDAPLKDVAQMETNELIDTWFLHRNSTYGAMAADEMMKRLHTNRRMNEETKK